MEAVTNIWKNFNGALYGMICKKVNHQDHCNDILQELYIKVIQNIDKIERSDKIKSYLFRMADHTVTDYYRIKSNKPSAELTEDSDVSDDTPMPGDAAQLADCCLRPIIESLEPLYREALILTELEGLTQKQYAEKIGISVANAKVRVYRAKFKLKEAIQSCCSYYFDRYGNVVDRQERGCCSN